MGLFHRLWKQVVNLSSLFIVLPTTICITYTTQQTSANRGPNSTFVDKVNSTRSSPELSSSQVIKLRDQARVTRPRGESLVKITLKKVKTTK